MLSNSWKTLGGVIAGLVAIAATVLTGFFYLLLPILVVPLAWYWTFAVAWFGFLMLTIVIAIRSPIRALIVPPIALVVVVLWLTIGQKYLGWAA
jgi:hypothetical protein